MTTWIDLFKTYLESATDPTTKAELKQEYITWVKAKGAYYSSLKSVCPEFLELLNSMEDTIGVQVKIEKPKKKDVKESADGEDWIGPIEAKGTKGLNATPWQRAFKNVAAMEKWVEANDATVDGVRESDPGYTREKKAAARLNKEATEEQDAANAELKLKLARAKNGQRAKAAEEQDKNVRLDEISKSTLGSYIKKANQETNTVSRFIGVGGENSSSETELAARKELQQHVNKRKSGISKAVDKLTNEGWEADLAKKNRDRMAAEKQAAKADAEIKAREAKYLAGTEKKTADAATLSRVFMDIEMAVGDSFPDGDPMDVLMRKYKDRYGDLDIDLLNKAAKANGAKDYHSYVSNVWKQYSQDNPDLAPNGNPFESYTNAISKMLGEAKDVSGDVQVTWTNRDYKEKTKTFKNDPKGAPENAMVKAKAFKEKLDKDEDVRSVRISWVK
jgi:hypothetical protein